MAFIQWDFSGKMPEYTTNVREWAPPAILQTAPRPTPLSRSEAVAAILGSQVTK